MKKYRKKIPLILSALSLALLGILLIVTVVTNIRLKEFTTRLTYMQDTTDVIRTDLGGLQSQIEQTLREENSILESCSFTVTDADFAEGTYTVEIDAIPKEYTDDTELSVFFGAKEYALTGSGFRYHGTVVLPLTESYEGNVTMLIKNGKKKSTEVLSDYEGFQERFEGVLTGALAKLPEYRRGRLTIRSDVEFQLEGADTYGVSDFTGLTLSVSAGDTLLYEEQLLEQEEGAADAQAPAAPEEGAADLDLSQKQAGAADSDEIAVEETEVLESGSHTMVSKTVKGSYGTTNLRIRKEIGPLTPVRIVLTAVSTDAFRFEYVLFSGITAEEESGFTQEEADRQNAYLVYDSKGNLFEGGGMEE